jgi:hypothetical protein
MNSSRPRWRRKACSISSIKKRSLSRALRRRHHLENRCCAARYFARAQAPRSFPAGDYLPDRRPG